MIQLPSQFNTLVQGLSIASITPQQILAAGEPIFLDIKTSSDINSINTLVQSYARIHSPAYGQPIAGSSTSGNRTGTGGLLSPAVNTVHRIVAINYVNNGAGPIECELQLGGVVIEPAVVVNPGETRMAVLPDTIFADSESYMYIAVTSGIPADLRTNYASILICQ